MHRRVAENGSALLGLVTEPRHFPPPWSRRSSDNEGETVAFSGSITLIAHYPFMLPTIIGVTPELRSKALDRLRCGWHVRYEFCGLSAEIAVTAENEAEARAKAVDQLRRRGLKLAA
jgi:hypothetical protein